MSKASPIQNNFSSGEITPLISARTELVARGAGMKTCLNLIPLVQGPATGRPGTYFVNEVKDSTKKTRVVRFEFSTTQAYIIEFGNLYVRFYMDGGRIESPPTVPVEVVTPYVEADLFQLKFTQSADVLYIAHPGYAPRKLSRTSHTAWTLTTIDFLDGPYLNVNGTATTITPSAVSGSVTLTASAALFAASDVGRPVRIKHSTTWGWAKITAYTSPTAVTALVVSNFAATTASPDWRLGAWSSALGYPGAVTFFEDRLWWGGATTAPQRVDSSKTGLYETMSPTGTDGAVASDNGVSVTLNANGVNVIRWLSDDEKGLFAGTLGGTWVIRPSSLNEALTPTNVSAKRSPAEGTANIQALRISSATLFAQRGQRALRELKFDFTADGFKTRDLTVASEHILASGVTEMAYQELPQGIVWCVRGDGTLVGLSYAVAEAGGKDVIAWHRHLLGGAFGSGNAVVESVAVIPAPDGSRDELWLVVKRTVNGATKRYIEYMTKLFQEGAAIEDAFFVDCGLTYSGAPATTVSGLDHLEGQVVTIIADGSRHPNETVVSGQVTLDRSASEVHVGLGYNMDGELLSFEAGAQDGTAQGKIQRIHKCVFRLHNTVGMSAGRNFNELDALHFRDSSDTTGGPIALFSGDKEMDWPGDYEIGAKVCFRQSWALPFTLLAVMPQITTEDKN